MRRIVCRWFSLCGLVTLALVTACTGCAHTPDRTDLEGLAPRDAWVALLPPSVSVEYLSDTEQSAEIREKAAEEILASLRRAFSASGYRIVPSEVVRQALGPPAAGRLDAPERLQGLGRQMAADVIVLTDIHLKPVREDVIHTYITMRAYRTRDGTFLRRIAWFLPGKRGEQPGAREIRL